MKQDMAEVRMSVDEGGAAHEKVAATHQEPDSARSMEQEPGGHSAPLLDEPLRRAVPQTRPITPDEWLHEDDYWTTHSLIAVSGRRTTMRPEQRPLAAPPRFQQVHRWQSMAVLIVLGVGILAACVGIIKASRLVGNLIPLLQPAPASTQPVTSPTVAPSPSGQTHNQ
jgi:hypothetical protein